MRRDYVKEINDIKRSMIADITNFVGRGNTLEVDGKSYEETFADVTLFPDTFEVPESFRIKSIVVSPQGYGHLDTYVIEGGYEFEVSLGSLTVEDLLFIHGELNL